MESSDAATIPDRLRECMEKAGEEGTPTELSQRTGISYATAYRVLHGQQEPKADTLRKIAEAYGVTVDWLLSDGEEDAPFPQSARAAMEGEVTAEDIQEDFTRQTILSVHPEYKDPRKRVDAALEAGRRLQLSNTEMRKLYEWAAREMDDFEKGV